MSALVLNTPLPAAWSNQSIQPDHILTSTLLEQLLTKVTNYTIYPDTMRLTRPTISRNFGLLQIAEQARVVELDSGNGGEAKTVGFPREALDTVLSQTVIVVPCKDEDVKGIEGVISAIPASCLVILVSNCNRGVDDQYLQQVEMLKTFAGYGRQILALHQKDLGVAAAFRASGMPELLDPTDGTIRNGKGEGMLLAIAAAAVLCPERRYIGFVDADNLHGGSVNEYCRAFASGFAMYPSSETEHCMVRLRWASKPKMRNGKYEFVPEGRCSKIVNSWLNKLLPAAQRSSSNDAFITTGNAGEHAMTMDLALTLRMAAGYAIEPFHYIDILERGHLFGVSPQGAPARRRKTTPSPLQKPVRVLQVRTANPHFHRATDDEHIRRMWAAGLGAIYHYLTPYHTMPGSASGNIAKLRQDMHAFAVENGGVDAATGELPRPRVYPALEDVDLSKFREMLEATRATGSLRTFGLLSTSNSGVDFYSLARDAGEASLSLRLTPFYHFYRLLISCFLYFLFLFLLFFHFPVRDVKMPLVARHLFAAHPIPILSSIDQQ